MGLRVLFCGFLLSWSFTGDSWGGELTACNDEDLGDRALCGTVTVAEDRSQPEGRTIDLEVVLIPAVKREGRAPLFLLAGGPGQAATDLAGLALGPWASVLETRDAVLVDQRGTGGSNLIDCESRAAEDPSWSFGQLFDPANIRDCFERASDHADVTLYSTPHVVADLEEVRRKLGYDKVILWGGSGGTRTALVWMQNHPGVVEAAMLDGVTPTYFRSPSGFARWAQDSLDRVFEDCAADSRCSEAYPDLARSFDEVLALFDDGPVETSIRRDDGTEVPVQMYRGDFGYAIRGILYSSRGIRVLPGMIHEAALTSDVAAFAQRFWQRDVVLRPVVSFGVHLSVGCTEDVPFLDRARLEDWTAGTFLDTYLIDEYSAACEEWRGGDLPDGYFEPVDVDVPVLLVSGYYDPSTPSQLAEEVAGHLPNSRHIVVRNEAHGSGFGCARPAAIAFLESGSLEDLGPTCEDIGPIEFELP